MRIAMLGVKTLPSASGVEKVVEEVGSRLVARGHEVTVFTRAHLARSESRNYRGIAIRPTWSIADQTPRRGHPRPVGGGVDRRQDRRTARAHHEFRARDRYLEVPGHSGGCPESRPRLAPREVGRSAHRRISGRPTRRRAGGPTRSWSSAARSRTHTRHVRDGHRSDATERCREMGARIARKAGVTWSGKSPLRALRCAPGAGKGMPLSARGLRENLSA